MTTALPPLTPNAWLRWGLIRRALRGVPRPAKVLEVGTGQGAMGARIARRFDYLGVELDADAAELAAARIGPAGGRVLVGDALPLTAGRRFDVVCAFEVLEHLEDDAAALAAWIARVEPGGRLVLSVPQGPERFGPWDAAVGHFRRYAPRQLGDLLWGAGLEDVRVWTYGFPLGYLLEAVRDRVAARSLEGHTPTAAEGTARSGRWLQPSRLGWATALGTLPFRLLQRPFAHTRLGTGLVATARVGPRG
ncbi:MAG: class I SAM-dependent methyltransferase [Nitriliruptor sp.]|nr:MAG: class I SAM-dependent methyltransferase [Nitriliruptor sp.]TVR20977.1 MAG: class I SAM-dependent methyltransferase [Nitriliruptor sp.]